MHFIPVKSVPSKWIYVKLMSNNIEQILATNFFQQIGYSFVIF